MLRELKQHWGQDFAKLLALGLHKEHKAGDERQDKPAQKSADHNKYEVGRELTSEGCTAMMPERSAECF